MKKVQRKLKIAKNLLNRKKTKRGPPRIRKETRKKKKLKKNSSKKRLSLEKMKVSERKLNKF